MASKPPPPPNRRNGPPPPPNRREGPPVPTRPAPFRGLLDAVSDWKVGSVLVLLSISLLVLGLNYFLPSMILGIAGFGILLKRFSRTVRVGGGFLLWTVILLIFG